MKYKIKSMKVKKQPTKSVKHYAMLDHTGWLPIHGGAIGTMENKYDCFSDMYIEFYPEDESLPSIPLVTITHTNVESNNDEIRVYVFDGGECKKYSDKWSIKELTELAKEW